MPRPSLLQAIFQQPSQPYVIREQAFAQPAAHPRRAVFPLVDDPKAKLTKTDSIGRRGRGRRPASLDVEVEDVPTLPFDGSASPHTASSSPVSTSPSPTPPPLSPASTPKSSTPSFTDETSDSSTDPEFATPPDSPKPPAANTPASVDIPCNSPPAVTSQLVRQTLPTPPESLLLSARRPPITPSSSSSSSLGDLRSLFSSSSSDGTASTSRRSSPVSSSTKNASASSSSTTTRPHGVRQTPLSGVPDWAKDVRWLVGHQPAAKRSALSALADPNYHPQRPLSGHVRAATAPAGASSRHQDYDRRATDQFGVYTALPPRPSGSRRSGSRRIRAATEGRRSGYRMSALVEVSESEESGDARPDGAPDGLVRKRSTSQQRTRTRPHSIRSSSSTSSSRTVLATPLPVSSGETIPGAGYTSLTLPRAGYTLSKTPDRPTSTIDLAKNGLAQTSMSAISIIRSSASTRSRRTSLSLSLNSSRSSLSGMSSRNTSMSSLGSRSMLGLGMGSASIPLAVRLAEIDGALGLTSHSPPSRKVGSSQVLVQVHAVALDSLDALIISQRLAKGGYGFIPGRSFVGRAIECGFEVASVGRGEWVIGLTDIRKCGALSEFIVVDRGRVCAIPRPTDRLTTTQCALLPLCAVPAHRAVRTIPYSAVKYGPRGERRPMRVLVLQAHDGAGLLAVQEMRGLGMRVTAQVPVGAENVRFGLGPSLGPRERGRTRAGKGREVDPDCGRNLEAVEVVVGDDPIEVISRLEEGVYDAVIDTVGGRAVWDACRRVMCSEAHFTTLVGDSFDTVPSMNAHVRSSFRSLARAFTKQSKAIGYQWVSPAADLDHEGEDIRHSLTAVADAAVLAAYGSPQRSSIIGEECVKVSAGMLPRVTCSFPLERASDAFAVDEDGRGPLVRGGTVVVRVL